MSERTSPHSIEAERSVLGAVLLHNDALTVASDVIAGCDFFRVAHRRIFDTMRTLADRGVAIDLVTLKEELIRSGGLDTVGGPAYIAALVDGMPQSANVEHYAGIIKEKATLRNVIAVANKILATAYEAAEPASVIVDGMQQDLANIAVDRAGGFVPMKNILHDEVMPRLEELVLQKRIVSGVPTGLIDLDELTRGFQPSDLVIVAARPSMGKTSLVLNAALHAATVAAKQIGIFSLEMSRLQLGLRATVGEARIDANRLQAGRIFQDEWVRLSAAIETLGASGLHIDDSARLTVPEVRARARRLKTTTGLDAVVVDYIQLMKGVTKGENRNLELGEISGGLKALAKDLNIPVVVLSQLSRACEARSDKRPQLGDLRDSGALEADADLVVFIYRDEHYNRVTSDRGVAELSIAKHRNGPIGVVKVGFEARHTRFFNLETRCAS